jgi:DNA-binding response OmpR family regulator
MRVLFVDDDLDYINSYLAEIQKDYIVDVAYTADEGSYRAEVSDYDVIVIDSNLPDEDSYRLCREVRDANISSPILVLSDNQSHQTRTQSLLDGANVCLLKSSPPSEVSAQIKALTRLRHSYSSPNKIKLGNLVVDLNLQQISSDAGKITLRKKEFSILEYLLLNRGRIVPKEELLDHIWEEGILVQSNSLEVHMRNLRLKLEVPFGQTLIKTLRGFGYRID